MARLLRLTRFLFVPLLLAIPSVAFAQAGTIAGRVTDRTTGLGVPNARVEARGAQASQRAASATREDGSYTIGNLAAGTYTVLVTRVGQQVQRRENVSVRAGETTTLGIEMTPVAAQLEQLVTVASRKPEKVLDAPASVSVVTQQAIEQRPSLTLADHLKSSPGIDVSSGGIVQSNIVARGFNNAFSGATLMLQDYRFAGVPSLRVNVPFLFTGTNEDIDRVEVLLGPAAALYGPNSARGVLHTITKSPFDSKGTMLTVDGGSQSILRTSLRHAAGLGDKAAFKLSGEFMQGEDFKFTDLGEPVTVKRGTADVGRDFSVGRYTGEGRLDVRPVENMELITTYGLTHINNGLEITGANGASQIKNWTYQNIQQRVRWGNLFAQVFMNMSDAGNKDATDTQGTFLLRSGQPIVDQSRVTAGSVQHSWDFGAKQSFIYGGDFIKTDPRTGGTINGRNEAVDNVTEKGAYLHSVTHVVPKFDVVAALRVDQNSVIKGTFTSPRVGVVFKPTQEQNFRATYNRAYSTPANFSYFLDLIAARNPTGLGYDIRALGVPPGVGFDYARTCAAGVASLCMRSVFPSALGAANSSVDLNAAAYYKAALAVITPSLPASVAGLLPILNSLNPTSAQVGTVLRNITATDKTVDPSSLKALEPLKATFNNTMELGYKGLLGKKARLSVDLWREEQVNFTTASQIVTPNAFLDPTSLGQYLGTSLATALIASGMPAAQAQATAAAAAPAIAGGLARVPVGVVALNNSTLHDRADIIVSYRNVDTKIFLGGADVAFDYLLEDGYSIATNFSWVSADSFPTVDGGNQQPLRINAPSKKGSFAFRRDMEVEGRHFELRARYHDGFKINSGLYSTGVNYPNVRAIGSTYSYDPIHPAMLFDASYSMRLPHSDGKAMWSLSATNLLNHGSATFVGVPSLGRMLMTRVQYSY